MKIFKSKKSPPKPAHSEEEIQGEIRRRIFKEARKRDARQDARETTQATLDALEKMVPLSREEMERIAEEVRKEYTAPPPPASKNAKYRWLFSWATIALIIITFFLMRRGSSWIMISGLILLFILFNVLREHFSDPDDQDDHPSTH